MVVLERVELLQQQMLIRIVVQLDLDARVAAVTFVPPVGLGLAALLARSPDQWPETVMVMLLLLLLFVIHTHRGSSSLQVGGCGKTSGRCRRRYTGRRHRMGRRFGGFKVGKRFAKLLQYAFGDCGRGRA